MNSNAEILEVIERWVKAVREEDMAGIRADRDPDVLMYDVPPPFRLRGVEDYMGTWELFFSMQARPLRFELRDVEVTAGEDVGFATAIGRCFDLSSGEVIEVEFRLTMGFRKRDGRWWIVHEHHSVPAGE